MLPFVLIRPHVHVRWLQGKAAALHVPASGKQQQAKSEEEARGPHLRFSAEAKFLSGHVFVSDGLILNLPYAAQEVQQPLLPDSHHGLATGCTQQ
jgi:hypothetical protein